MKDNVLYVGAHPDDIEFGCAGTILKKNNFQNPFITIFSLCGTNSGLDVSDVVLKKEMMNSMKMLGIIKENIIINNFENTKLPEYVFEIRNILEKIKQKIKPKLVYCPYYDNNHQDHVAVAKECLRVFRTGEEIRCYELPSDYKFNPNLYIDITSVIENKIKSLSCYNSQTKRIYMKNNNWISINKFRGYQVGLEYAESYVIIRRIE